MFKIGEFSRIGRVTIETLRHYDACGLLKPAKVDPSTGYRYYAASQLQLLNKIIALKEVGFSLEEVDRILRDSLTTDQLRGMLKAQLIMTERAIESDQLRQERIQARLNYLNVKENMPVYEVTLKPINALCIASIREIVSTAEQVPGRWRQMFTTIAEWVSSNQLTSGPALTIYHNEGYTRENIDTECAFILHHDSPAEISQPASPLVVRQTEAYPHAATTVVADWQTDGVDAAYHAIGQWLGDHHYRIIGAPREIYFGSPESGDNAVEIQFPVERGVK